MNYIYADKKRADSSAHETDVSRGQPSMGSLLSGAASPTSEQMGHRVDLPDVMREKMESAFGADLSAVKLYESEAVADADANAITRGADIVFAPGMLDFTSYGGQALLGHEISHVVSQQRGEVTGGGFLNDQMLEARADREGSMAAAGQQVALPVSAMSSAGASPAAGPMQADKLDRRINRHEQKLLKLDMGSDDNFRSPAAEKEQMKLDALKRKRANRIKKRRRGSDSDLSDFFGEDDD